VWKKRLCYARLVHVRALRESSVIRFLSYTVGRPPRGVFAPAAIAVAAYLMLRVEPAQAEQGAEPVRLEFQAEPTCPDAAAFLGAVLGRTPRIRAAEQREQARTFHVTIARTDDGRVTGDFSVIDPDDPSHASSKRTITGESCAEVFDALALFAAMSVDPQAGTSNVSVVTEPVAAAQLTPAVAMPGAPTLRGPDRRHVADPPVTGTTRTSGLAGVHVGAMDAGAASGLLLVEPFVELRLQQVGARGLVAAPALRLSFSSTGADTARVPEGLARLHWTTFRLDGCPIELRVGRAFSARPCLAASEGALSATGIIANPGTQRLFWSTLGGVIRAEWNLPALLVLEANVGVDAPLRRDRLYFEPSTPVYRAPAAMPRASLGVGLHFR
jgi:hypothetical protein